MENVFQDPVQLSKGINLKELMTTATEFHIDMDFKKKQNGMSINMDDDFFPDMDGDDSDEEDVLKNIEDTADKLMLSSPEYHSFDELSKKMIDCSMSNGAVKILIIEEGDGPLVPVDAEVTLHYAAYWEKSNIPFDSTLTMNGGTPLTIRLGKRRILPGLELGLTMVHGPRARAQLLLAPAAAWGPRGAPPRIRPERALFVISLYAVSDVYASARFNDLPMEEQTKFEVTVRTVNGLHAEAKGLFSKKRYKRAIKTYQHSMSVLGLSRPKTEYEEDQLKKLKITTYINLAVCYCKVDKPKYALIMCENLDRISNLDKHCKGLFYYGRAHNMLGRHDEALTYYKKALKLEPKNKDIGKALADLDAYLKSSAKTEKEIWQNAFQSSVEEKKEKVVYAVDEDFQDGVREMCKDLAGRSEYAKFDLPLGLTKDEVDCIKSLADDFQGLHVLEDGEGKRKKVSIVKKISI
ncbi:inactive peptidyl-prolyl cis-trans isomerase shutdown-like [Plodia interpunctella]|uniref:inactive peptidyl-prolyl cis-trans isomerase shutdown-like n=1 Tax=Plodia interpunctella TaxID=58824 RepID=UPI002368C449|nr:inactive peptidyl-prolyl cis-trans isomerase shutdown-like [Plodia interpunctella]XP_053622390.1 inactive peptidyl-prolyl cis-trans isomerase shutdown-like [Plodia interpunctella]